MNLQTFDTEYYEPLCYQVGAEEEGWKLRTVLQSKMFISRQLLVRLKRLERGILVNGERKYADFHVQVGDIIEVRMPQEESDDILPQAMELDIVHEDEQIMMINKPAGLIVHPTHGHYINTLANGVVHYWKERGIRCRFRPVQRLDQDTSGLLLIAKTPFAHQFVALQLLEHSVEKQYLAFAHGRVKDDVGIIDAPIERLPEQPHKRAVLEWGDRAVTHYEVIERYSRFTLLRLRLLTGRTHQIRVHMEHLGHPLLADALYGDLHAETFGLQRHALHAQQLGFVHPGTRQWTQFRSELPPDLAALSINAR